MKKNLRKIFLQHLKISKKIFQLVITPISCAILSQTTYAATGDPVPGLTPGELAAFNRGLDAFLEVETVPEGLGPKFNLDSCAGCHSQPAVGGTSPQINPQIAAATRAGAINTIPFFIKINGPVREPRFIFRSDGTRDGSVHQVFVITGRSDAPGCNIPQPDFTNMNNISLRIPTPVFGAGLIQEIADKTIVANKTTDEALKRSLGINGHENRNGNDNSVTRFGWKAQNKSINIFSGEAYNNEMGVTNEEFQNELDETASCVFNPIPEDTFHFDEADPIAAMSDVSAFTQFMRFLAPPPQKPMNPKARRGQIVFNTIGCALCHTPQMVTATSSSAALSNKPVNLFSDLLVHHMGSPLADGIIQGSAGIDEFRTAPLWGVGDRLFFLHDGRATNLKDAILMHRGSGESCNLNEIIPIDRVCQSEANVVIARFNTLPVNDQSALIAYLKTI